MVLKTQDDSINVPVLTKKDFATDADVRWCPGCGDYSVLAQMQKMAPNLGVERENIVFVSGIGCSSRFPYYMNTYGFHSIHGRAPTLATGLKLTRPELLVFVITGDGDGLSIGGNHLLHVLRRNVDVKIILFNNRIYGLTKGQYSPTSEIGKTTKSSPMGTVEMPLNPLSIALAAEATFIARSSDTDPVHLANTLEAAARHKGPPLWRCSRTANIFNDGAFRDFTDKPVRKQRMIYLEHGQPMRFGETKELGIALDGSRPVVVDTEGSDGSRILVHDSTDRDATLASILARMSYPELPVPVGIFRQIERPTYGDLLNQQIVDAKAKRGDGDLLGLVKGENTWLVE